jgi:hypothetical protein
MSNPSYSSYVGVKLPQRLYDKLRRLSQQADRPGCQSDVVRRLIDACPEQLPPVAYAQTLQTASTPSRAEEN